MELSCFTTERNYVASLFTCIGFGPSESLPTQNIL